MRLVKIAFVVLIFSVDQGLMSVLEGIVLFFDQELEEIGFIKSIVPAKIVSLVQQVLLLLLERQRGSDRSYWRG